jgi:hypothetical protein
MCSKFGSKFGSGHQACGNSMALVPRVVEHGLMKHNVTLNTLCLLRVFCVMKLTAEDQAGDGE